MFIIKNALVSISRNKSRNLLIGVIVIVIACAATVTFAIRSTAQKLIESYENQYDITATIGVDREAMRGEMKMDKNTSVEDRSAKKADVTEMFAEVSNLSVSDIEKYGDSEYVQDYYYTLNIGVNANSLEKVSMGANNNDSGRGGPDGMPGGDMKGNFQNLEASDFTLTGYSSVVAMTEFLSGKYTIAEGELSDDLTAMNCVVSSELASLNSLEIGDKITFVDPNNTKNTITLKVTGIFEESEDANNAMGMFSESANTIITNVEAVNTLTKKDSEIKSSLTPTFILTSRDVIENFEAELQGKGLDEHLSVITNLDQVDNATSAISNVSTFATAFLIIALIIGGVVLFVINIINIRERKYEIGVLRTIGMKKKYLTLQFVCELLIVSLAGLVIGGVIGAASSVPISNHLLENEIASSSEQREGINKSFGGGMEKDDPEMERFNGVRDVQAFDSINATVNLGVLLQVFGIGIILTLISSIAAMISIQKFSPLTILKERS